MPYDMETRPALRNLVGTRIYRPNAGTDPVRWLEKQQDMAAVYGVFTSTVELSPELARALLDNNPDNRTLNEKKAAEYAEDISAGRWAHNGETVIVANTGELNDGQKRCRAVEIAQKSIITQMTFGVDRDTRTTVDVGVKRTASQHLGMAGFPHYVKLAMAVATVLCFKKTGKITTAAEGRATSSEIMRWAESHPEMTDSVIAGMSIYRSLRASAGLFGGLHFLFSEKSKEDADKFFALVSSGEMLGSGHPAFELRAMLIRERDKKAKLPESEFAGRAIKAWNAYRSNSKVAVLRMVSKGIGKEDFPTPK